MRSCRSPASTPAEAKPLTEVAEQVKQDWLTKARRDAADAKAKEIAEKLKTPATSRRSASSMGLVLQVTAPFTRGKGDPDNGDRQRWRRRCSR